MFEIINRIRIDIYGNLPLEILGIRILPGVCEIIFVSHTYHLQYCSDSAEVAFLAEIIRITESDSR